MTKLLLDGFVAGGRFRLQNTNEGPLAGLTFAMKDVFDIAGQVTGAGNPDWWRTHGPARENAPLVDRLLEAGAVAVGRTITEELAFSLIGENMHYGTPPNPRAPGHVCGGSSSGSASVVAAGLADFSLGTDTAGSIRIPASNCGLFGLRPTHGRLITRGIVPLAQSFDTPGWFAADPKVLGAVSGVILADGQDAVCERRRLRVLYRGMELLDVRCRAAFLDAVGALGARTGLAVEMDDRATLDMSTLAECFRTLQSFEVWHNHGEWIEQTQPRFAPDIAARFDYGSHITAADYAAANEMREMFKVKMADLLGEGGYLVLPSAVSVAPRIGLDEAARDAYRARTMQLTCLAGLAGLPQISLPLAVVDGLPLGVSVVAGRFEDHALVDLVSRLRDQHTRLP